METVAQPTPQSLPSADAMQPLAAPMQTVATRDALQQPDEVDSAQAADGVDAPVYVQQPFYGPFAENRIPHGYHHRPVQPPPAPQTRMQQQQAEIRDAQAQRQQDAQAQAQRVQNRAQQAQQQREMESRPLAPQRPQPWTQRPPGRQGERQGDDRRY